MNTFDFKDTVKLVFDPPAVINPIEIVYDENGEKILGWRTLGWKPISRNL